MMPEYLTKEKQAQKPSSSATNNPGLSGVHSTPEPRVHPEAASRAGFFAQRKRCFRQVEEKV
jgi:hypothetical protein